MISRIYASFAVALTAVLLAACGDVTSPARSISPAAASLQGGVVPDTSLTPGGGGGGGGQVVDAPCGVLTTAVKTTQILVYTIRVGIGFSGTATNCSLRVRETFDVSIVDQETNPACRVYVPRYIAARNTAAGGTLPWSAGSTLVPCQNRMHTFTVTLKDSGTGTVLATSEAQFFL